MNWNISKRNGKWELRKTGAKRATELFGLRREAIARARSEVGKSDGVIYVHNESGMVVVRIPELPAAESVAALVRIRKAADMTPRGRAEIAAWLRQLAAHLSSHGKEYASNFRARYMYG